MTPDLLYAFGCAFRYSRRCGTRNVGRRVAAGVVLFGGRDDEAHAGTVGLYLKGAAHYLSPAEALESWEQFNR